MDIYNKDKTTDLFSQKYENVNVDDYFFIKWINSNFVVYNQITNETQDLCLLSSGSFNKNIAYLGVVLDSIQPQQTNIFFYNFQQTTDKMPHWILIKKNNTWEYSMYDKKTMLYVPWKNTQDLHNIIEHTIFKVTLTINGWKIERSIEKTQYNVVMRINGTKIVRYDVNYHYVSDVFPSKQSIIIHK